MATGVTRRFGGLVALDDVSIAVPEATIVGLVGPNGAGKSTLFAILSGLLAADAGQVFIDGTDITGATPGQRARNGIARTFQHPELFSGLTIREHLQLALRMRLHPRRAAFDLFRLRRADPAEETARIDETLALLGLGDRADDHVDGLPLGTARLVELARAVVTRPRVILMDEGSSGLDHRERDELVAALRLVVAEGTSILLVEHDVELVLGLSSHVYVLDFGQMIADGTPDQIRVDERVRAAYLGVAEETSTAAGGLA